MAKPQSHSYSEAQHAAIQAKKEAAIAAGILDAQGTRKKLKRIGGESRETFYATFVRMGRSSKGTLTMLFRDVRNDKGTIVSDHLWFNFTDGFRALGFIESGELIQFNARVRPYEKGYAGQKEDILSRHVDGVRIDYKLSHPTKMKRFLGKAGQRVSTIEKWDKYKKLDLLAKRLDRLVATHERRYKWQEYENI